MADRAWKRMKGRDLMKVWLGCVAMVFLLCLLWTHIAAAQPEILQITDKLVKAAKAEGTLTIRVSTPADFTGSITRAFTERFGIKVEIDRRQGALATQQFLMEERAGQHIVDAWWNVDPSGIKKAREEGFLLNYIYQDNKSRFPEGTYMEGWGYPLYWTEIVISYNPKLIPHAAAKTLFKTWKGLLDPKLKGKIGVTEPASGGVPFATYLMFYQRPEYGRDFLAKIASQNPRLYTGSAEGREDLAAGVTAVFIPNWDAIAMTQFKKGDQTAWTYPEIAPAFPAIHTVISKNAPHANAARLFAIWPIETPEGARAIMNADVRPIRKGVRDEREAIAKLKQTDWWKPYPEEIRWVPDTEYWENNYTRLLKDMREVLGWRK